MKKTIALLLSVLTVIGIVSAGFSPMHIHAHAESEVLRWSDFEYTVKNGEACIVKYYDREYRSEYQTIPDTLGGYPVTSIGREAFAESNHVVSFTIPESVKSIGDMAFRHCELLRRVEIKGNLDSIGYGAFMVCKKLTTIILPEIVRSIGDEAFYNTGYTNAGYNKDYQGGIYCGNYLIAIEVPFDFGPVFSVREGTLGIAGSIGESDDSVLEVYIPDSVKYIGTNPFSDFFSLQKISLSENNPYFEVGEDGSLYSEDGKTLISNLPGRYDCCYAVKDGVEEIIDRAVLEHNIYIPKSVKKINGDLILAYNLYYQGNASEWQNVELSFTDDPAEYNEIVSDIRIAYTAYNSNLHRLIKKTDNLRYCSCGKTANIIANPCDKIRAENGFTYIPDTERNGVRIIGYAYNHKTDPVVIPETLGGQTVRSIGNYAFDGCQATSISIPKTVEDIDERAFAYIGGNLEEFVVEESNDHYISSDGVLLDSAYGFPVLFRYPTNKADEELTLGDNVIAVMYYAFANTKNLKKVVVSECNYMATFGYDYGIIADYAFFNSSVEKVELGFDAIYWLGNNVFEGSKLNEINLPNHIYKLGFDVFKNTPITNNEENYDADGVLYYDDWLIATTNERGPESYTVKDGTVVISGNAFAWSDLKELTIPKSVVNVGVNPTMNCPKFEKYTVDTGNRTLSADEHGVLYAYYDAKPLNGGREIASYPTAKTETCYVISGINKIRERAFANTKYLKNIYIPSGVDNIDVYAFGTRDSSAYMIHYGSGASDWENKVNKATSDILVEPDILSDLYMYYNHYDDSEHTVTLDVTVEPTCTEEGCLKSVCSCGYEIINETYEASDHTWAGEWIITEQATCTSNGMKENTCSVCGETVMVRIRKFGHDLVLVSQTEGNCTQQGATVYYCNRCKEEVTEYTAVPDGHKASEEIITVEATCASEGGKYYKCEYCQQPIGEPIEVYPATGEHTAGEWIVDTEPTCTTEGVEFCSCTICNNKLEVRAIPELGHNYRVQETVNCTETTTTYTCYRCSHSYSTTEENGGEHVYTKKTEAPTCTTEGRTYFACQKCEETEVISTTPATGHEKGEWVVSKEPTCGVQGKETQLCATCGAGIATRNIPAYGHNYEKHLHTQHSCTFVTYVVQCSRCKDFYMEDIIGSTCVRTEEVFVEPTCMAEGCYYEKCLNCGKTVGEVVTVPALEHNITEETTKEATCKEEGLKTVTCHDCGEVKEIVVEKLSHTFGSWKYASGNTFSGICATCGEAFEKIDVTLTLNGEKTVLFKGTTVPLTATVTENITDDIVFTSSDTSVVTVDENGNITAVGGGEAVVTAKIRGTQILDSCVVTVMLNKYSVIWMVDGAEQTISIVEEGSVITPPAPPEKEGFEFVGWSPEIPDAMPSEGLAFTAVFNKISKSDEFDVSATYSPEAFDEPVSLDVNEIKADREPGGVYMVEGAYYEQVGLYNIKALNEKSDIVQPNDGYKVTIRIALPEAYKSKKEFVIYHRFVGGGREQLSTAAGTVRVEDGYLIFEVESFSEFEIFVPSPSIKIVSAPAKIKYYYGEDIDLSGMRLTYTDENGNVKTISNHSLLKVSGFDSSKTGKQTVTVNYGKYSDTFEVEVRFSFWQWILRIFFLGVIWF